MRGFFALVSLFALLTKTSGQESRPLLRPELGLCRDRESHLQHDGHRYIFSWMANNQGADIKMDWLDARNYCRKRCMDTVAVESEAEWRALVTAMLRTPMPPTNASSEETVFSIWTSGRLCDFDGCEKAEHTKPVAVNGWFWSANNRQMSATTCVTGHEGCFHSWSDNGKYGFPQPDNRELREEAVPGNESCLSVMFNAFKGEGFRWHDRACYHRTHFVCEDSEAMLTFARRVWGQHSIPQ